MWKFLWPSGTSDTLAEIGQFYLDLGYLTQSLQAHSRTLDLGISKELKVGSKKMPGDSNKLPHVVSKYIKVHSCTLPGTCFWFLQETYYKSEEQTFIAHRHYSL